MYTLEKDSRMVRLTKVYTVLKVAVRGRILIVEASMSSQGRVIRGRSIQLCYLEGLRRHYTQLEDTYERFLGGEFAPKKPSISVFQLSIMSPQAF